MQIVRLIALSLLMSFGVAAVAEEPAAAPEPAAAAATAEVPATAEAPAVAEAPAAGEATIIFFRPKKMMGAAVGFKVREAGVELGKLRNGSFFALKVAPGRHQYVVHSETEDVLTMEVEAGETYYVQGTLGMGVVAGRPNLSPSDQATFDAIKDKLKERPPLEGGDD